MTPEEIDSRILELEEELKRLRNLRNQDKFHEQKPDYNAWQCHNYKRKRKGHEPLPYDEWKRRKDELYKTSKRTTNLFKKTGKIAIIK